MKSNKNLYDTSDFPKEHPLYSDANKKVLGKMKDECKWNSHCRVRLSETKNVLDPERRRKKHKKGKGVKKCVVTKQMNHENYKEALFEKKQFWNGMNILRSQKHSIFGMNVNKISLSPFDSKRWIEEDGINTKAY